MKAKKINEINAGDYLAKKNTGESCKVTKVSIIHRRAQLGYKAIFYFDGFVVLRDCMIKMFQNDGTYFITRKQHG